MTIRHTITGEITTTGYNAAARRILLQAGFEETPGAFVYEHTIVRPHDLSRLNRAFFSTNGFIGISLFVCALLDLLAWMSSSVVPSFLSALLMRP